MGLYVYMVVAVCWDAGDNLYHTRRATHQRSDASDATPVAARGTKQTLTFLYYYLL